MSIIQVQKSWLSYVENMIYFYKYSVMVLLPDISDDYGRDVLFSSVIYVN
jgi:hypothetical protein